MRVVFFGTPDFAVPSLASLINTADVAAVVTQPDRPRGRSHSTLAPSPVKQRALEAGIPVLQPDRPRDSQFYQQVRELQPDIAVVVAYGHLLRPELLAIPRLGFVNVHASLLPRWRGAAPIQWAILSGDAETGVSIMRVEEGLDTGAVWHKRVTAISGIDTSATLFERLAHLGAEALIGAMPGIASGASPVAQGATGVTHAPKVDRNLARIRWDEPAAAVSCRIRAMDPAPGAWTTVGGAETKIFGAAVRSSLFAVPHEPTNPGAEQPRANSEQRAPGTITATSDTILVSTGDAGAVAISQVQPAGKRRMSAAEWWRGAGLPAGARFE